jgi:hypothetical protein
VDVSAEITTTPSLPSCVTTTGSTRARPWERSGSRPKSADDILLVEITIRLRLSGKRNAEADVRSDVAIGVGSPTAAVPASGAENALTGISTGIASGVSTCEGRLISLVNLRF